MTKIYMDEKSLENNVIYNANSALNQLKKSIYDVGRINIPYEFEYSNYLKKIFDKNLETYNKLCKEINKTTANIKTLDKVEQINVQNVNELKEISIEHRKNMIN